MSDYTKYTKQEMQAYAIAKNIKENQIVNRWYGPAADRCVPCQARSLHRSCHPIVESGLMDCDPD